MPKTQNSPRAERRRVLIVGGAGYIGSILIEHLLAAGHQVRSFDLCVYGNDLTMIPFAGRDGFEFRYGDLTDGTAFAAALEGMTDVVLLAGLVGDPVTKKFPEAAARINDAGHEGMLRALAERGLRRVIFVSTCSNYGMLDSDRLADEDTSLGPLSLYAKSKVAVEKTLLGLKGSVDYETVILRFATAFGLSPRMRFDLTISEFTRTLYTGEELLVYDPDTWRPYCHVRDFADVISRVLEAPADKVAFQVFNAGGETNNFTKRAIVDAILKVLPEGRVRYQMHGSDPRNYRVAFGKIQQQLGFVPRYSVADGIAELVAALRQGLFRDIAQPSSFYGNWQPRV